MVKPRIELLTEPKNSRPELAGLYTLGERFDELLPRATRVGPLVRRAQELHDDVVAVTEQATKE